MLAYECMQRVFLKFPEFSWLYQFLHPKVSVFPMDEYVSDSIFLVLPLDILIFHDVYFTLLSEGVRHGWTNAGTQEKDTGNTLFLMSS